MKPKDIVKTWMFVLMIVVLLMFLLMMGFTYLVAQPMPEQQNDPVTAPLEVWLLLLLAIPLGMYWSMKYSNKHKQQKD